MDAVTHALVPMAGALIAFGYLRRDMPGDPRRAAIAAVFGIAGFSPDLDGLVDPLSERWDALYWMQHRGVSHTLIGAPVFALAALGALVLLARVWPARAGLFRWMPVLVPAAILGAWTHLVLDGITYAGVPLMWPFAFGRTGFPLFHWLVWWLFPLGAIVLGLHVIGRLSRRRVAQAGAVVVAILLLLGSARAATRPWDEPEERLVFPRSSELEWLVAEPHANGSWELHTYRLGERFDRQWFEPRAPSASEAAVERAKDTGAYRGFLMGNFGPVVVNATRAEEAWIVTFTDVAQRYEALRGPRWAPVEPYDAWGYVTLLVRDEGGVEALHRGW